MSVEPGKSGLKVRVLNEEVLYSDDLVTSVSRHDIKLLADRAFANKRRRARLCVHSDIENLLHEMLIVHTCGAYVRPHLHLNKVESLHVIEGIADLLLFDDLGGIRAVTRMGDYSSGFVFFTRIAEPCYHALLIRSEKLVFHEVTEGPFNREDTKFAPWSPEDTDFLSVGKYLESLSCRLAASAQA